MVYFLLSLNMLRKKPLSASKYIKDMLAYRKGPLAASCSKPLLLSMEANVALWRFLSSGATSNIFHPHAAKKCCNFSAANFICGPHICTIFHPRAAKCCDNL